MARHNLKDDPSPSRTHLAISRRFVALHGKPTKAVVEDLGRAGARVVLIGADGGLGDLVVSSRAQGESLIASLEELDPATWDPATVNSVKIGPLHRRRMAVLGTPRRK